MFKIYIRPHQNCSSLTDSQVL